MTYYELHLKKYLRNTFYNLDFSTLFSITIEPNQVIHFEVLTFDFDILKPIVVIWEIQLSHKYIVDKSKLITFHTNYSSLMKEIIK